MPEESANKKIVAFFRGSTILGGNGGIGNGGDNISIGLPEPTKKKWKNIIDFVAGQGGAGFGPGLGEYMIRLRDSIYAPQLDWKSILSQAIQQTCGPVKYTFNRPSRRFISSGTYIPAREVEKAPCELTVGIDVSGSMGNDAIVAALKELDYMVEDYPQIRKHLSFISTEMDGPHELGPEERYADNPIPPRTTGGTYLSPFFDYYASSDQDSEKSKQRVIVTFTDLLLDAGDVLKIKENIEKSGMSQVYWITNTPEQKGPSGTTLVYKP